MLRILRLKILDFGFNPKQMITRWFVGRLDHFTKNIFFSICPTQPSSLIIKLDILGVLILVVTLVGCCGISRESHSLVLTYSLLLSVIFLAEVGAGVLAYLYRESLNNELSQTLTTKFHQVRQKFLVLRKCKYSCFYVCLCTCLHVC